MMAGMCDDTDHPFIVTCGLIIVGIVIAYLVNVFVENKRNKEANRKLAEEKKKVDFMEECLNSGVTNCLSERNEQKAKLIARKYGLSTMNITQLYQESYALYEPVHKKEMQSKRKALLDEEWKQYRELVKYCNYKGRDKRIAMLTDEYNAQINCANTMMQGSSAILAATQQKEKDWALMGGIASGLAGGAAGVATAADIQRKNAEIRAGNRARMQAVMPEVTTYYKIAGESRQKAQSLLHEIDRAKTRLVSDESASVVLQNLEFTDTHISVSETGTCLVTTMVRLKHPVKVFDSLAIIDGVILAKIQAGSNCIATAQMVLPTFGVNQGYVEISGMCVECANPGTKYQVQFDASNLWIMER